MTRCVFARSEGDDGDYHSPKSASESVASGYFSATESNASGLPARILPVSLHQRRTAMRHVFLCFTHQTDAV